MRQGPRGSNASESWGQDGQRKEGHGDAKGERVLQGGGGTCGVGVVVGLAVEGTKVLRFFGRDLCFRTSG